MVPDRECPADHIYDRLAYRQETYSVFDIECAENT